MATVELGVYVIAASTLLSALIAAIAAIAAALIARGARDKASEIERKTKTPIEGKTLGELTAEQRKDIKGIVNERAVW